MAEIPQRLHWACRRGMLELDVLLGNFLEKAYFSLNQEDKTLFERLLECNDQDLFEWLMDKRKPEDLDLLRMVEKVRAEARNRY